MTKTIENLKAAITGESTASATVTNHKCLKRVEFS